VFPYCQTFDWFFYAWFLYVWVLMVLAAGAPLAAVTMF